jgi:hypothetical protein
MPMSPLSPAGTITSSQQGKGNWERVKWVPGQVTVTKHVDLLVYAAGCEDCY